MKVILLQDVAKIGRRHTVVDVPSGYALNKLIPKKMAEQANPVNLKKIERFQAEVATNVSAGKDKFEAAKTALNEKRVQIAMEVNEKGHAFKAVHEEDIVVAADAEGIKLDVTMLKISSPIKDLGEHKVTLVGTDSKAEFIIEVIKK